jgi:thiol-disulfide isomerase/thioredoxin
MKFFTPLLLILLLGLVATAQTTDEVLATSTGHMLRLRDLSAETQKLVADAPANHRKLRADLFDQLVSMRLLQAEAAARNTTTGRVILAEYAKVKDPTAIQIKAVYDQNRSQLGNATLEQVRKQIVEYLRYEPQQKALSALLVQLKPKYRFAPGKDVNAANLAATDVIGTVNGKPLTAKEFETFAAFALYEARDGVATAVLDEVEGRLQNALSGDEANALGIDASALIAREITDKMKDFTDEERDRLAAALFDRLYTKYKVNILYKRPEAPRGNISPDDDPATGPIDAPVTVVMFSDFQCSACKAIHPLLKEAMAAYPGKIRFVVRDFPLETIHPQAYRSALAGYAAHQQGKFFDYIEILYENQSSLDDASLIKYASQIGLNAKQFELDFNSEKAVADVRKDMIDGENYGVNSTPTIFINGVRARNFSADGFKRSIDQALKK